MDHAAGEFGENGANAFVQWAQAEGVFERTTPDRCPDLAKAFIAGWYARPGADFTKAVQELVTDEGTSREELPALEAGIRALAWPAVKIGVQSECGHSWDETRPAGTAAPVNGELRVCGHPDCYPGQFPVTYSEPVSAGQ